jgi:hypothetical protein
MTLGAARSERKLPYGATARHRARTASRVAVLRRRVVVVASVTVRFSSVGMARTGAGCSRSVNGGGARCFPRLRAGHAGRCAFTCDICFSFFLRYRKYFIKHPILTRYSRARAKDDRCLYSTNTVGRIVSPTGTFKVALACDTALQERCDIRRRPSPEPEQHPESLTRVELEETPSLGLEYDVRLPSGSCLERTTGLLEPVSCCRPKNELASTESQPFRCSAQSNFWQARPQYAISLHLEQRENSLTSFSWRRSRPGRTEHRGWPRVVR